MNHNLETWFISAVHAAGAGQHRVRLADGGRGRFAFPTGDRDHRAAHLLDVPAPLRWMRWGFARLQRRAAAARRDGHTSSA